MQYTRYMSEVYTSMKQAGKQKPATTTAGKPPMTSTAVLDLAVSYWESLASIHKSSILGEANEVLGSRKLALGYTRRAEGTWLVVASMVELSVEEKPDFYEKVSKLGNSPRPLVRVGPAQASIPHPHAFPRDPSRKTIPNPPPASPVRHPRPS